MKKYAKLINEETRQVEIGLGTNVKFYETIGFEEKEVEQAYDGFWYLLGYAPEEPAKTYDELRAAEYPPMADYLDAKVKQASSDETVVAEGVAQEQAYLEACLAVKAKYPKTESE